MIRIHGSLSIPESELRFTASRGGGPGGQHVNKAATRMTLWFDVAGSPSLGPIQRARLLDKLAGRINRDGVLHISSHASRSQAANRDELIQRFRELVAGALKRRRRRKPTRPGKAAKQRRLDSKKHRGKLKRTRGRVRGPDDG